MIGILCVLNGMILLYCIYRGLGWYKNRAPVFRVIVVSGGLLYTAGLFLLFVLKVFHIGVITAVVGMTLVIVDFYMWPGS